MRNKIKMILFVSFIWLFGNCTSSIKNKTRDNIRWKETIGILETAGRMDWIHYEANDVQFISRFYLRNYGEVNGEKYVIRYNIDNPQDVEIEYWNPVFEKDEKTIILKGKIIKVGYVNFFSSKAFVNFDVYVNGRTFNRTQTLPKNVKKIYPNLKKGQYYKVECEEGNLRRCIIHLDKPVSSL